MQLSLNTEEAYCYMIQLQINGFINEASETLRETRHSIQYCLVMKLHLKSLELLDRVRHRYRIHARVAEQEAHALIYRGLSFAIMREVADQFVGPHLVLFAW